MLRTELLDYDLPQDLVATHPAHRRDESRLLVVSRSDPQRLEHRVFRDLPSLLTPGDLLIFNTSAVLPARFFGFRADTGGKVEGLFLEVAEAPGNTDVAKPTSVAQLYWLAMIKSRRFRPGAIVKLRARDNTVSNASLELIEPSSEIPGAWLVRIDPGDDDAADSTERTERLLRAIGRPPLPPYIRAARRAGGESDESPEDTERYQTIYARASGAGEGSVAAPTAGLHFTAQTLDQLTARAIDRAHVTLHVGAGTFRTVEAETVEAHDMHAELCAMTPEAIQQIERTRSAAGRIIPVGSTSMRTIEAYARWMRAHPGKATPARMWTDLLLTPGSDLLWADGLLTNFHLPRSTLMALVAMLLNADPERAVARLKSIYAEAIAQRYRFYSYGDAMLVLP
ncbi:MAG: tRNA preQ1(34) S-adenosylmethionine ribosyltransferase-isomerase QueA [Phycisphaerales bacterium JB039]